MPAPGWKTEDVSRRPVEALPVNHRPAASLHYMVDDASRVTMRLCLLGWSQHLNPAIDGRHNRTTGKRIRVMQRTAVVWTDVPLALLSQPIFRLCPAKVEQRRILVSSSVTGRQEPSGAVAPNRIIPRLSGRVTAVPGWI